ncbi:MAG TPA: hypothetical protein VII73_11570 [Caulobacteraceae bacterium]
MNTRKILIGVMSLALAAGAAATASAQSTWDQTHPRRDEVNQRLQNQNHRIATERREGELTGRQAHRLHTADRRLRMHERHFAARHNGHISRAMQARLSHRENQVSRNIGQ